VILRGEERRNHLGMNQQQDEEKSAEEDNEGSGESMVERGSTLGELL
jgi:hypothetical protein